MQILRQGTAVDVLIGPFVDATDGDTAETGLTIAQADVRLSKNGQNMAQKNDNTSCAHDELGYYNCELDATDTSTWGQLVLAVKESGALPVRHEYMVIPQAAYDVLVASGGSPATSAALATVDTVADGIKAVTDNLPDSGALSSLATASALGTAQTDLDTLTGADGATLATSQGNYAPAKAGDEMDLVDAPNATAVTAIQNGLATATALGTVDSVVDAIELRLRGLVIAQGTIGDTNNDTTHLHLAGLTYADDEINEYVIVVYDASEDEFHFNVIADWDLGNALATVATLPFTPQDDTDTYWILAAKQSSSALTAGGIADAVWDEVQSGHTTGGSFGEIATEIAAVLGDTNELQGDWANDGRLDLLLDAVKAVTDNLPDAGALDDLAAILEDTVEIGTAGAGLTDLGGMSTAMKAEVNAEADTALSDYDPPTKTELDSGFSGLNDLSAADVNAEVDTALADINLDHLLAVADADDVADDSVIAKLAASDGDWSGFDEASDSLEAIRDNQATSAQTGAAAALNAYDPPTDAEMDSAFGALNDVSEAEVNAQVVDALATDTYAEPGQGAPGATITLEKKLSYLYQWARNKADNDGSETKFYADDASTVAQKQSTTESSGTVTKGEMATGA